MAQTLYASFADATHAEKAAGALLDYGVRQEDISLVANDERGRAWANHPGAMGSATDTSAAAGRAMGNAGDRAIDDTKSVGNRIAQASDRAAGAVTGALGADSSSASYHAAADQRAVSADVRADMAGNESAVHGSPAAASVGYATGAAGRSDLDEMDTDDRTVDPHDNASHQDNAAKHGISTTTPQDAGAGAVKGAGVGLILGAIAAFAVPGIGWALGGGALASALGATALAAGAGAIAGGATGYLKDQGVPSEAAERYHGAIQQGGALLAIQVPSNNVDQATVGQLIAKYGGSDVNAY